MRALLLLFSAFGLASAAFMLISDAQDTRASDDGEAIVVPISMYILVDDIDSPDSAISSNRTIDDLETMLVGMNDIWLQANIEFEAVYMGMLAVPIDVLEAVNDGDFISFFEAVQEERIDVPDPTQINGFYAQIVGGANGIVPYGIGTRNYFVMDNPSVFDRRVSAHEIGHILNLHHTLESRDRLLYPGTNGMTLTEEEITVARYVAQGMLDRVR